MVFQLVPQPKKLHHRIARKERRAPIKTARKKLKMDAKARDEHRCRWPKFDHDTPNNVCLGPLESAHRVSIKMGGDKDGSRTSRPDLISVCRWIHQDSPEAFHKGGRTWEGLTDQHADGPILFSKRVQEAGEWRWVEIARERSIGILA